MRLNQDPGCCKIGALQTQSHVLVVEPGRTKDAVIERALRVPGVDVRYTSGLDETLSLFLSLLPSVIILDSLTKEADSWRLIARIWAEATKRSHHIAFILLADQTNTWQVDHFGPGRRIVSAHGDDLAIPDDNGDVTQYRPTSHIDDIRMRHGQVELRDDARIVCHALSIRERWAQVWVLCVN